MNGLDLNKVNQKIISALKASLNAELVAVVSSGSSSGNYIEGWSDLDYLVVVKQVTYSILTKIKECFQQLKQVHKTKFGLNVISHREFLSPPFPTFYLEGKTLQTLLELNIDKTKLLYPEKIKTVGKNYIPTLEEVRQYSLLNIGILKNLNRRNIVNIQDINIEEVREATSKIIHISFIIAKLAIQFFVEKMPTNKRQILKLAEGAFRDFDFLTLNQDLASINNWNGIKKISKFKKLITDNDIFIEEFANYVFNKAKRY